MGTSIAIMLMILSTCSLASWSSPEKLAEISTASAKSIHITSLYRDPTSAVNHVVISQDGPNGFLHLAVSDSGKVLYQTAFKAAGIDATTAVIRGAGDGEKLFLAFWTTGTKNTVSFTESTDGGNSWTAAKVIVKDDVGKNLQDMIYIPDTGRIFVFFTTENGELKTVNRAPGSAVFSAETLLASKVQHGYNKAKAVFNYWLKRPFIHVAYVAADATTLMYTKSTNNGITWLAPKKVASAAKEIRVAEAVTDANIGPMIYFTYTSENGPAGMVATVDFGVNFKPAVELTTKEAKSEKVSTGLTICGTKDTTILSATFATLDGGMEYAFWSTPEFKAYPRKHPFKGGLLTAATVCTVKTAESQVNVRTFVTVQEGSSNVLYYAVDTDFFPAY